MCSCITNNITDVEIQAVLELSSVVLFIVEIDEFNFLLQRPIPCRLAAARTLLVYLRHMESLDQRDHICKTLVIGREIYNYIYYILIYI